MEVTEAVDHAIVSHAEWVKARKQLLEREKEFSHAREAMSAAQRELPWERVDKEYVFQGPYGPVTLSQLFNGRSQLIVYHFMLGPGWDAGCPGCSYMADHLEGPNRHLPHHDVTVTCVSRAPYAEIVAYNKRMGWDLPWVSSNGTDFNFDYGVSFTKEQMAKGELPYNYDLIRDKNYQTEELPGLSIFYKDASGQIFHTYSTYARGLDDFIGAHHLLDVTPKGRNEKYPEGRPMDWVRRHDEYEGAKKASCCHSEV